MSPRMLPRASGRSLAGSPASSRCFQRKVLASKSLCSVHWMMWPMVLLARGFAASTPGRFGLPRRLLLVNVGTSTIRHFYRHANSQARKAVSP